MLGLRLPQAHVLACSVNPANRIFLSFSLPPPTPPTAGPSTRLTPSAAASLAPPGKGAEVEARRTASGCDVPVDASSGLARFSGGGAGDEGEDDLHLPRELLRREKGEASPAA